MRLHWNRWCCGISYTVTPADPSSDLSKDGGDRGHSSYLTVYAALRHPRNFIEIGLSNWPPPWLSMEAGGAMAEVGLLPYARIALQVSWAMLPRYRSRFSKRQFTQPQLLAILPCRH